MFESVHNYYIMFWVLVLFFNNLCPYHLLFCLQYCFRMFEMQAILCVLTYNLWKKNWTILMCILTFDSHTCINLTIIFKKKIRLKNGNAHKFNMLCSALELLTFGSKDRVEGIMQESFLKRKSVMDMFQKIIDRNIKCCKLIFVF